MPTPSNPLQLTGITVKSKVANNYKQKDRRATMKLRMGT